MPIYTDKKSGRHRIQFQFGGAIYSKRLDSTYTKKDAEKLETKWKHDLMFESFGIEKKKDVFYEDFLADYFLPFAERHYSSEGLKNVIVICKESLKFLKGLPLRKITPFDVERFKIAREKLPTKHDRKRKPATIHRELNILSKVFSQAVKNDFLDYNPCSKVDRPAVANLQDKVLSIEQIELLLNSFNSTWARDVVLLILNTGLRQRDALGLKKFNVDFEGKIIRLIQGKNQRPVLIPLNETVGELLESRRSNGSELFFPSPKTGRQGTTIKKALLAASARAKLGKVGTRILRRSFGTRLAELNFNPSAVAKLLGHSNLQSVHRYERETEILRSAVNASEIPNPAKKPPASIHKTRKLLKIKG